MPKVKSELTTITEQNYHSDSERGRLHLQYNINVNSKGVFYTNLLESDVLRMESRGLIFQANKRGINGYFEGESIDDLNFKISTHCKEYFNVVELSRTIVIKYAVSTSCIYLLDENNEVVPNGRHVKDYNGYGWIKGTNSDHSTPTPYGMSVCATPLLKIAFKYNDGTVREMYRTITNDDSFGENLNWLINVTKNKPPDNAITGEVDYTEEAAQLFVDMIKWICKADQTIKEMFSTPARLEEVIKSKSFNNLLS